MPKPKWNILLVDDDVDFMVTIDVLLREIGNSYHLSWMAHDGITAEMSCSGQFDAVLLGYHSGDEINMGVLDRVRVICEDAPVIVLCWAANREIKTECMARGAAAFLLKDDLIASALNQAVRWVIAQHLGFE